MRLVYLTCGPGGSESLSGLGVVRGESDEHGVTCGSER